MKRTLLVIFLTLALSLLLSACGSAQSDAQASPSVAPAQSSLPTEQPTAAPISPPTNEPPETAAAAGAVEFAAQTDQQGAVEVTVTPQGWATPPATLDFAVTMDTHSVDLSFDLASLATLTTDTGLTLKPLAWDAPSGGHHVTGTLTFPAGVDGQSVLEGAGKMTLTIQGVDAPERIYTWDLAQ